MAVNTVPGARGNRMRCRGGGQGHVRINFVDVLGRLPLSALVRLTWKGRPASLGMAVELCPVRAATAGGLEEGV
jgi:hypothetical protein